MLQRVDLLLRNLLAATEFGILRLLQVGQELLLGLSALKGTVLFGVHTQFEEFLVVGTVLPAVLVHLLAETVEGVVEQRVRIDIGKLAVLLLGQFHEHRIDGAGNLS